MPSPADKLSPRQRECLQHYWARQSTSKEIAADLGVSKHTVDGYFKEAIEALGARDRRDAARIAFGMPPAGTAAVATLPAGTPPAETGADPAGVPGPLSLASLLPLRKGAHNDLSITARLVWIFGLAVLAAIGFGTLANGVGVLNSLVR